jgi:hypothetical protein
MRRCMIRLRRVPVRVPPTTYSAIVEKSTSMVPTPTRMSTIVNTRPASLSGRTSM